MGVDYGDIGRRIRQERKNKGMTQEKLAEYSGITVQHMSNIENGNARLSLQVLVNIANALNANAAVFLVGSLKNNSLSADLLVSELLADSTVSEKIIIADTLQALKDSLKANRSED